MTRVEQQTQWAASVNEYKDSGLSQAAWCKIKKINLRTFNYWFIKSNKTDSLKSKPSNWISLKASELNESPKVTSLTVRVGQAVVEVKPGFDPKLLLNIVKALGSLC